MNKDFVKLILRRIATSFIVLFLMTTFIFILLRISPGDPAQKFISPELSAELADKVREFLIITASPFPK